MRCITGAISGANLRKVFADIVILSPGTVSSTRMGVSIPILVENLRSCPKSKTLVEGLSVGTDWNI